MKSVFMILLIVIDLSLWVLATGSSFNICTLLQGVQVTRCKFSSGKWSKCCCQSYKNSFLNNADRQSAVLEDCFYAHNFVSTLFQFDG